MPYHISIYIMYMLYMLLRYMQRSSAQTFNVLPSADTVFPALTICPSYGDAYIKPVLAVSFGG